ncbi:hypothetical protein GOP47_0011009 [Adiantum capillus-veneris]|uniref:BHLH domain-containing protein n=1 Tax=Adiantum capillus-veneris TaxID=13818 RepID=A0A9D4UWY8_ADICA|nr:hypothetical protein GOP47_0010647 [Adiantum capillus-veneris]KAI5075048.1 hypothetical protein GOP47_0011009 [Adiantum capillus-veneris]
MGPHEQLRYLLNGKGVNFVLYWRLTDDQRSVELTGCCCSGTVVQNELETNFNSSAPFMEGPKCPDIAIPHLKTRVCEYLIQMPQSTPLESGLHGQVLFTGQPQWINMTNSDACALNEVSQAKVYVPMPTGLLELGLSNQALDNPSLLQSVMDKCGEIWMGSNTASMVVNVPEYPLTTGFAREMQNLQGMIEENSMKKYQTNLSVCDGNGDPRVYRHSMYSAANSQFPWTPSADMAAWGHETPLNETHLSFPLGSQQLHYPPQAGQVLSFTNQKQRGDFFEGIGDSLHQDRTMLPADQNFSDIILPMANYPPQKAPFIDSPRASGLSKEVSDKDVKQEMRAESSDCSDQMEDDEEKGVSRSGRRHLSKNLVAERKRRKKLNERLYSLRALVPKITKMDRASILGDAIEYVKELQKQVKELQEELLETKEEDIQDIPISSLQPDDGAGGHLIEENGNVIRAEEGQCSLKTNHIKIPGETNERRLEDSSQPMQVEVSKIDGKLFSLRIFCEKRPGVFVKLMQALDVLGLEVLHANITTFRGLVLNVFNAETRDKDFMQAEQVKESLLEMASLCDPCTNRVLCDMPLEKDLIAPANI